MSVESSNAKTSKKEKPRTELPYRSISQSLECTIVISISLICEMISIYINLNENKKRILIKNKTTESAIYSEHTYTSLWD